MQAVLFEIQLLKSQDSDLDSLDQSFTTKNVEMDNFHEGSQAGPEFSRDEGGLKPIDRKASQGGRSILLKGEMRYLKDVNMLVFLCSPLWVE